MVSTTERIKGCLEGLPHGVEVIHDGLCEERGKTIQRWWRTIIGRSSRETVFLPLFCALAAECCHHLPCRSLKTDLTCWKNPEGGTEAQRSADSITNVTNNVILERMVEILEDTLYLKKSPHEIFF